MGAKDPSSWFAKLRDKWGNCDASQAYDWLRRISVTTVTEDFLREEIEYRAGTLVRADAATTAAVLAELALDSIHKELDAQAIWSHLKERGLERRVLNNDPHVLQRMDEINERYLQTVTPWAILGRFIPRVETDRVMEILIEAADKRAVLITGDAGSGKSIVVAQVVQAAEKQGWLRLAFRMDRLDPVSTSRQLGGAMDLPESPVRVLASAAADKPCLLVIDQLDAVSKASGRHPDFFERVGEMIREFAIHSNMRLVLSCRSFDLANDERLRRLVQPRGVATEVKVQKLSQDVVCEIVNMCGLNPDGFSDAQMQLLAVPHHLKLLTEIAQQYNPGDDSPQFESLEELYDQYWRRKRQAAGERRAGAIRWNDVIDAVLERMTDAQALSISADNLEDEFDKDLSALVSEGVLVKDGSRLSFFHETFFDYAFARRFAARGKRLPAFVRERGQHLFLRAPVRQILAYTRAKETPRYLGALRELLIADDIRFHLKHLVFAWLRALPDPTADEWDIVRECIRGADAEIARHARRVIISVPWFRLLDELGHIQAELDSGDHERETRMVQYLRSSSRDECAARVARLALLLVERGGSWLQRAWAMLTVARVSTSHLWVELYQHLVQAGVAPVERNPLLSRGDSSEPSFPSFFDVPEEHPEWALDAFETWLVHFIRHHELHGRLNPFNGHMWSSSGRVLDQLARSIPDRFVERMLPIVLELARGNAVREGMRPWPDQIWRSLLFGGDDLYLSGELLEALVTALERLAVEQHDVFARHADMIDQYLDFTTAGHILARAYAASGERFADRAADFMLSNSAWLQLGWYNSEHWISRELLAAITSHCSEHNYRALEASVLGYYTDWERGTPRLLGQAQLVLLPAFAEERRSLTTKRRLGELERKFSSSMPGPPRKIEMHPVGPPFDARWEHIKDRDWLSAIKRYDSEENPRGDFLGGGAREVASRLQKQAKEDPERFARLIHDIPDDAHPAYFDHLLRGLSEACKAHTFPCHRADP